MSQSSHDADVFLNWISRKFSIIIKSLEVYNNLLNTVKANLEDRLERIDDKLQHIIRENVTKSKSDEFEARLMREKRLSTIKCLQVCAQLFDHISQIQLLINRSSSRSKQTDLNILSESITYADLQKCKNSLAHTTLKLKEHEKQLFDWLINRSKTANISKEKHADIARLWDELTATRQGMNICSRVHDHIKDNVSIIDNYVIDDVIQFMISISEKIIHDRNRELNWRTRQVKSHISNELLQQIAWSLTSITISNFESWDSSSLDDTQFVFHVDVESEKEHDSKFKKQYERDFKLTSCHTFITSLSDTENDSSRSSKK